CFGSRRIIAKQFDVGDSSVQRHQQCIVAELQAFNTSRSEKQNETLLERLARYRGVAEQFLHDDEKALAALDRCYKQIDIEAKLKGAYQKKQENEHDPQNNRQIQIEAFLLLYEELTLEQAIEREAE